MDDVKITPPDVRKLFYKVRARFLKLERDIVGEAIIEAAGPIIAAAKASAPVLQSPKAGRFAGQLRESIGIVRSGRKSAYMQRFAVGPLRKSRGDKRFPFWGLFQEKGWHATGRARRRKAPGARFIAGSHFMQRAGMSEFGAAERIFARKVTEGFEQMQEAGEQAGIV